MDKCRLIVFAFTALALFSGGSHAWSQSPQQFVDPEPTYYDWYPDSKFEFGYGFTRAKLQQVLSRCIDFDGLVQNGTQAVYSNVTTELIYDAKSLNRVLNYDVHVSARYLSGKVDAAISRLTETASDEKSLSVVVKAISKFQPINMIRPRLSDAANKMARENPSEFARKCGTHYVVRQTPGVIFNAVITLHSLSTSERQSLMASLAGSAEAGVTAVNVTSGFSESMEKVIQNQRANIEIFTNGGTGFVDLVQIVKLAFEKPNAFGEVFNAVSAGKNGFNHENATGLVYDVAPMNQLGADLPEFGSIPPIVEQNLRSIVTEYHRIVEEVRC
jgi:hypothetical protein